MLRDFSSPQSTSMPIKDILFHDQLPDADRDRHHRNGGRLPVRSAPISRADVRARLRSPVGLYAHPVNVGGILAAERAKAPLMRPRAAFDDIAARRNVLHARRRALPADRGRPASLPTPGCGISPSFPSITDRTNDFSPRSHVRSGGPCCCCPGARAGSCPRPSTPLSWPGISRPAARRLADAFAAVEAAKRVHVVTVVDEAFAKPRSASSSASILPATAWVAFEEVTPGRPIGDTLEAYSVDARPICCDRRLWSLGVREFILGGATTASSPAPSPGRWSR